jgi:hypothetical protein
MDGEKLNKSRRSLSRAERQEAEAKLAQNQLSSRRKLLQAERVSAGSTLTPS